VLLGTGVRRFYFLLAWFAVVGACTPEAIEVDPSSGAAGEEPTGSGGDQTTGATDPGESGSSGAPHAGAENTGGSMPSGGKGGSAGGGNGGSAGGDSCAPISSPKQTCTDCIPQQCPTQASACEGNACTCGEYGGYQGQMNCLLACATLSPMMSAANTCASQCGFGSLGNSDPAAHQLFDCLVNPPKGPPLCPDCFPVH
jgi:hypothetical protein